MPISQAANAYSHDLWNRALTSVMASDQIRADLLRQLEARGIELKAASLALGRNHAYLHRFIHRGIPRYLHEEDRRNLSEEQRELILRMLDGLDGGPSNAVAA